MRPLELTLSILTILSAILYLIPSISTRLKYQFIPAGLIAATTVQILYEGFRWQLWPVVFAIFLIIIAAGVRQPNRTPKRNPTRIGTVGLILSVFSLGLGWVLPVPQPFPITGPYQVGTTIFPLTDTSRTDRYADQPDAPREIMVQIWYPAAPTEKNQRIPWIPNIESVGPALADWFGLPSFSLDHLIYAYGNTYLYAPVASGNEIFPVLVFSHGWSGFKEQNIYQVEELASHGYVVVGIDHTYGAVLTVFPNGREIPLNNDALPEGVPEAEYDTASNRLVRQWAGDISFALDEIAHINRASEGWPLAGRIDLGSIGIFGHSTGGGAAAEFCATDPRCDAVLMMDLWAEPLSDYVITQGLLQPFLLMHSAGWTDLDDPSPNLLRIGELVSASSGEMTEFRIAGTEHYDFSILPLLSPLAGALGLKGPIPGGSGLVLINYYTVAFFDQYLRGEDQGLLLPANSPFEAAQFNLRP